jgi:hypothetical protein
VVGAGRTRVEFGLNHADFTPLHGALRLQQAATDGETFDARAHWCERIAARSFLSSLRVASSSRGFSRNR